MQTRQISLLANVRQALTITDTRSTPYDLVIYNDATGTAKQLSIGDSTVLPANGVHLYAGEKIQIRIGANEVLYGISDVDLDIRLLATMLD